MKPFAKAVSLAYSIGLTARDSGDIVDVHLDPPPTKPGSRPPPGSLPSTGASSAAAALRRAIADAAKDPAPITLIVKDGDYYKTCRIDYHEGEKYPHLVRDKIETRSALRYHPPPRGARRGRK